MQWMSWTRDQLYAADGDDVRAAIDLYNQAHRQQ
jgi:hypothetical protein